MQEMKKELQELYIKIFLEYVCSFIKGGGGIDLFLMYYGYELIKYYINEEYDKREKIFKNIGDKTIYNLEYTLFDTDYLGKYKDYFTEPELSIGKDGIYTPDTSKKIIKYLIEGDPRSNKEMEPRYKFGFIYTFSDNVMQEFYNNNDLLKFLINSNGSIINSSIRPTTSRNKDNNFSYTLDNSRGFYVIPDTNKETKIRNEAKLKIKGINIYQTEEVKLNINRLHENINIIILSQMPSKYDKPSTQSPPPLPKPPNTYNLKPTK